MTKSQMAQVMERLFNECNQFREAGQQEYAHNDDNAFANFERVASHLGLSRESVLLVYFLKHVDGISAYVRGHRSQREDVRGRIKDAIVYLCLLAGMVEEDTRPKEERNLGGLLNEEDIVFTDPTLVTFNNGRPVRYEMFEGIHR